MLILFLGDEKSSILLVVNPDDDPKLITIDPDSFLAETGSLDLSGEDEFTLLPKSSSSSPPYSSSFSK